MASNRDTLHCPFCTNVALELRATRRRVGSREYTADCPRCGAVVAVTRPWLRTMQQASADGPDGRLDIIRDRQILGDLPCAGCGYNLKFMKLGGRCPECGRRIVIKPPRRPRRAAPWAGRPFSRNRLIFRAVYMVVCLSLILGLLFYVRSVLKNLGAPLP